MSTLLSSSAVCLSWLPVSVLLASSYLPAPNTRPGLNPVFFCQNCAFSFPLPCYCGLAKSYALFRIWTWIVPPPESPIWLHPAIPSPLHTTHTRSDGLVPTSSFTASLLIRSTAGCPCHQHVLPEPFLGFPGLRSGGQSLWEVQPFPPSCPIAYHILSAKLAFPL